MLPLTIHATSPNSLRSVTPERPPMASRIREASSSEYATDLLVQPRAEELERAVGLGVLLSGGVDLALGQERAGLGRDVERVARRTAQRELEDSRVVRVEPELGHQAVAEVGWREPQLQDEDRAEHLQRVELEPLRCMG